MPVNPYERLKEKFREYVDTCEYRQATTMFELDKSGSYSMQDVYERIIAAGQLGHEVVLFAKEGKIFIKYRKNLPERPWEAR